MGEGGIITTNNIKIADSIGILRSHGLRDDQEVALGYNYRMTDIQAAVGIEQMKKIELILKKRIALAHRYNLAFLNHQDITTPFVPGYVSRFNYQSYVMKINKGLNLSLDKIIKELNQKGIFVKKATMPIHLQPYYLSRFGKIYLKNTEKVFQSALSLPLYPELSLKKQDYVIKNIIKVCTKK